VIQKPPIAIQKPPIAIQKPPIASGALSLAIQKPPVASGALSLAIQKPPIASGALSLAIRKPPIASGALSLAIQKAPIASGALSLAIRKPPIASGALSLAIRKPPIASGALSFAIQKPPTASGALSFAIRSPPIASSALSLAIHKLPSTSGSPPNASGGLSFAIHRPPIASCPLPTAIHPLRPAFRNDKNPRWLAHCSCSRPTSPTMTFTNLRPLLAGLSLFLAIEATARAQPAPPPPLPPAPLPAPPPAPPTADQEPPVTPSTTARSQPADGDSWRYRYSVARERLLAGDFADAAARFDELLQEATDPIDRELATNMRDVARSWATRGLVLVKQNALGESPISAKSVGERSTDEIAQLYADAIVYGLGTGLWLDAHTQSSSTAGVVLPMLLFAGGAVGAVALVDVNHPLPYGVPQSIISGMYLGFEEGLVLSLWNESLSDQSAHWKGTAVADVIWGLSSAGAIGGGLLGANLGATPGRASLVSSAALWSSVITGFAAGAFTGDDSSRGTNALLAAGLGLNAGAVAGLLAAGPVSPSIARVRFLDIGAVAGGLLSGGLYLAAANHNVQAQPALGVTALGIAGGLGVAWAATSGMPADRLEEKKSDPSVTATLQPTLTPVPGGATLGMAGLL
jgi:hypothetical protein